MKQIVCIAQSNWSSDPERTQHLMRLVQGANILYFELNTTSNPSKGVLRRTRREGREPHPGVTVYRVPTVYFHEEGGTLLEKCKTKWEDRAWKFVPIVIALIALIKSYSAEIAAIWQMLQSGQ